MKLPLRWVKRKVSASDFYCTYAGRRWDRSYRAKVEFYRREAKRLGLPFGCEQAASLSLQRMHSRLPTIARRAWGQIHTYLVDDNGDYTRTHMYPALQRAGKLFLADWLKFAGCTSGAQQWPSARSLANAALLNDIRQRHSGERIDVTICACRIGVLLPETVAQLRDLRIPIVSYWMDDIQSLAEHLGGVPGQAPLAPLVDLHWTTVKECVLWHLVEGGAPIYLPEAAEPEAFTLDCQPTEEAVVCFVGKWLPYRDRLIRRLRLLGLQVQCYGEGWPSGKLTPAGMAWKMTAAAVNLGVASVAYSPEVTCLKGRDFEAPLTGKVYLTCYSDEVAQCYEVGKEIKCYRSALECEELAFELLNNEATRNAIGLAGKRRAMRDHTYEERFKAIFSKIGLI